MTMPQTHGILLRLDWNSNNWTGKPNDADIASINFKYVKDNNETFTYFNLNKDQLLHNGYKYALAPQLVSRTPLRDVKVCFFISTKENNDYIVGIVLNPDFQSRRSFDGFPKDILFNIRSAPKNFYQIQPEIINLKKFLPSDKELGTRGFNYLTKNNCIDLIKEIYGNSLPSNMLKIIK
jgi:hypothetical protein